MTFLNPLVLLAGVGIALPIVAHLLNRYQVRYTPWAAMQFLNRSVRVRSRQLRLRDVALLLFRCLAVLLLAIAFARPATNSVEGSWLPGERSAGVIIALDSSFSMQHRDGDQTRFERALEQVESITDRIRRGDPVSLVLLGDKHEVVLHHVAFESENFREILMRQQPSAGSLDLETVPKQLQDLVKDMDAHQKEIYILTDVQTTDWATSSNQIRESLQELTEHASLFLVPVSGSPENLCVSDLMFVSGSLRKGAGARYEATVQNRGSRPVSNIEVKCRVEGAVIDAKRISMIKPASTETVSLFVPFHNAGPTRITAEINGDSLAVDNVRRVVATVRERVSILCVDGSSGDAGRLVVSALLARDERTEVNSGRVFSGSEDESFEARSVSWLQFPEVDLQNVDVVVMANVPEITADQASRLSTFVRSGKGLVWFAGDEVKVDAWNQRSAGNDSKNENGATPLLPAVLGQPVNSVDAGGAGKPLDPNLPDHVLCRPLRSLPVDLLSETRFVRRLEVTPIPTSFSVLQLAGSPAPVLLEHTLGRGQVVMFTTSADATWNNMALTPVFPMLMQQIVTYLAGREFEPPKIIGDSLALTYVEQPDASDAVFVTPSDKPLAVPVKKFRDQFVAILNNAQEAGFYVAKVSVQTPGMPIAVNVNTRESDVACLPETDLANYLAGTEILLATSETDLVTAIDTSRTGRSSWRFFMIVAFVFLMIESLMADRLLRRRSSKTRVPERREAKPSD